VTPACREVEVLISLGASGALEGAEAARLDAHLEGCPACRAAKESMGALLDLARLPPPSSAESLALADLPARTLRELRRRERRSLVVRRTLAGGAVAAAVALALLAPALLRSRGPALQPAAPVVEVASAATWEEPDMTTLWEESAVLDLGSSGADDATVTDAVLAAYDDWDGT
jgi:anti-sigma factor RsiW